MNNNRQRRVSAFAVGFSALAMLGSACGSSDEETQMMSEPISPLAMVEATTVDAAETSSAAEAPATEAPAGDVLVIEVPAGEAQASDQITENQIAENRFAEDADDWQITVLGPAMAADVEYVQLVDRDEADADTECVTGWLGLQRPDGSLYRYEDLGQLGYLRLFNGPRGQDALVASCEESVERVLVQGSALAPDDGVLQFVEFPLGEPYLMEYLAEFGWRGDLFGGYAWSDGWNELVYFDTGSELIVEASVLVGTRQEYLEHGFDFIMPDGWDVQSSDRDLGRVTIGTPSGTAWMTIEVTEFASDPEFPESVVPIDFWTEPVPLWEYVSPGRASRFGVQDRPTWTIDTGDGTRTVMHLVGGPTDVIVDLYVADDEPSMVAVANAAAEQIRVYRQAVVG